MQKFSQYMNNWLYDKNGYYSKYKRIGKDGDFYTAVSSSRFFGGSIGKKFVDMVNNGDISEDTTLIEIGAHHGYLLADMIQFIYTLKPELIKTLKFAIVERYQHLRDAQIEYFQKSFGENIKLIHFNDIKDIKLDEAFIVANEIFDAFPCELIKDGQMAYINQENFQIEFRKPTPEIQNKIDRYKLIKGEIPTGYEEFAKILSQNIKKFDFITFDYGDLEARTDFSIRIYDKHKVYPYFEENLNMQKLFANSDITYDVNFQILKDSFEDYDIKCVEYSTQLKALVNFGLIDLLKILQDNVSNEIYIKEVAKVKTIIEPSIMGERFKMIYFKKI